MTPLSALRTATAALALAAIVPAAAQVAPAPQFMPAPTPTADALAAQMRQLGANPRDVYALIAAGELSTKLGDPAAALGFFGRAQAIEPANPRIAAGRAGALILLERPGEALRLYDQAERSGVAMTPYLAQRGLAYDLVGQPGYAQRDYRRALLADRDDETVRRLALSLGISGRRDEAMALLDPLLRRSDRAAWRARACILAISGDVPGADRIAVNMLAGGSALSPFFARLQWLSPADRAFAVHFGEVGSTVARSNDARLAPALAALPGEPQALPAPAPVVASTTRARRPAAGRQPIATAAVTPAPSPLLPQVQTQSVMKPAAPVAMLAQTRPAIPSVVTTNAAVIKVTTPSPSETPVIEKPVVEIVTLPTYRRPQTVASAPPSAERPVRPAPTPAVVSSATPVRTPEVARRNTELLASIIGTIAVPASELDVAPPPRAPIRKIAVAKPLPISIKTAAIQTKPETKKTDAKKADAKKAEAKKPDPAKTAPARWWVQLAGGANAADLGKDWRRLTAKSPATFRGRTASTTPLRATNRLLTGPFASQTEAMAFVNTLAKTGVSAFAWRSDAGQQVDKLAAK